jgi:hypothetical protein
MQPNPIGTPQLHVLDDAIKEVLAVWKESAPESTWWTRAKGAWFTAVGFVIEAVDYLIRRVDDLLEKGADKKATVLKSLETVYDAIVPPLLPIWLKPFNSKIKHFVVYVVASLMIDFIVGKYRTAAWLPEPIEGSLVQPELEPVPVVT